MKRVNVVYALIYNKKGKQVLMVNNKDHEEDSWSLPGGAVEEDETLEQAAKREVQEETGLLVKIRNVAAINERLISNVYEHALFFTFIAEVIGGEICIHNPDEISEIKWMDIGTAEKLMPYHREGIKKLMLNSAIYCFQE